jgi:predicted component of type VI protein secretion system
MQATLLVVHGRPEGKVLMFPPGEYVFGRGSECHIRPNSDWVSRQHCLLRVTAGGLYVRDLGSRNGTLVNGARILEEHQLRLGDQLVVGPLVFEVQSEPPVLPPPPAAEETATFCNDTAEQPQAADGSPADAPSEMPPAQDVALPSGS